MLETTCVPTQKRQTCVVHIRNKEASRKLNISWCGKELEHTPTHILGVIFDRTVSYSTPIATVKAKTAARNNVLKKLSDSKLGAITATIRTTPLALCYSTVEYVCQVWESSAPAHKVNSVLNDACRSITGCLQQRNIDHVSLLTGIAPPPAIR